MPQTKIKQHDISDCGAACLASVAAHYRLQFPIARIRQYAGTDQKGTNLLGLMEAAQKLGFQAKGVRAEVQDLLALPLPAIAHVVLKNVLHHYVVVYKVSTKTVVVMDPGPGEMETSDFKTNIENLFGFSSGYLLFTNWIQVKQFLFSFFM